MSNRADNTGDSPSWRGAGGGSSHGSSSKSNSWRRTSGPPGASLFDMIRNPRMRKLIKALAVTGSLMLSGGLVLLLAFMPGCTQTQLIVAAVDSCQDCLIPSSTFVKHDAEAIEQAGASVIRSVSGGIKTGDEFSKQLKKLKPGSLAVVFLSAQGGYFAEGGVGRDQLAGLFWNDSHADEHKTKSTTSRQIYSISRLFDELKALPPKQPKLLLLDLGSMLPHWRTGMLGNWSSDQLESQVRDIPNLIVINSCSPGERSWGGGNLGESPQGRSAFGNFVASGLQGAADANRDRRITFLELSQYIHDNTNAWVWQNRDASGQHPLVLPRGAKLNKSAFIAISSRSSTRKPPTESARKDAPNLKSVWTDLEAAWTKREQLKGDPKDLFRTAAGYQFDPISWRAITHDLLEAEQFRRDRAAEQAEPLVRRAELLLTQLRKSIETDVLNQFGSQPFIAEHVVRRMRSQPQTAALKYVAQLSDDRLEQACQEQEQSQHKLLSKQGDELRRLAEDVACGPLGTRLIADNLIVKGDGFRRTAEDHLFLPGGMDEIQQSQQAASRIYTQARELQRTYYQMQCLRNRLLAELPEQAVWAAFRAPQVKLDHRAAVMQLFQISLADTATRMPSVEQLRGLNAVPNDIDRLNIELLVLFQLNRDFEKKLKDWATADAVSEAALKEAQAQIADAGRSLQIIEDTIRKRAELLNKPQRQPQMPNWRDLAEILAFPELASTQRVVLNGLLSRYSEKLQEGVKAADNGKAPAAPPDDSRAVHARWHGLWAIHTLSRGQESQTDDEELWSQWAKLPNDDDPEFLQKITVLGDRIRRAFIINHDRLKVVALRGEQSERTGTAHDVLETVVSHYAAADRSTRNYVDSCAAAEFAGKPNPTTELRQHQMGSLLLSLARQYLDDYWNGWYDQAVAECLKAAETLSEKAIQTRIPELQTALKAHQAAYPTVEGNSVIFGSVDQKSLPITVTNRGLPAGDAAFWLDVPMGKLNLLDNKRLPIALLKTADDSKNQSTVDFKLKRVESTMPTQELLEVRPRVYFRGHKWEKEISTIQVNPKRPVGIQFTYQAAPTRGKAIVEGLQKPVILFIMDGSGSMLEPVTVGGNMTRFSVATRVFEATLAKLTLQIGNDACEVGLLAYGGDDQNGVKKLANISLLDAEHQKLIVNAWGKMKPKGSTPLFSSMGQACDELLQRGTNGTIIAITDGIDYQQDPNNTLIEGLKSKLDKAHGQGVDLITIGFQIDPANLKTPFEQQKYAQMRALRGRFINAVDQVGLDGALREAVRIRTYSVLPLPRTESRRRTRQDIAFGATCELDPGLYEAKFGETNKLQFQISGGEYIKLVADRNGITHRKPTDIRKSEPKEPRPRQLQFGYQSYKIDHDHSNAKFLFTLSNQDLDTTVPRPAEMDIVVTPGTDELKLRSMEWSIARDQTVPTWQVTVQDWPKTSEATARAYWKMIRTLPDETVRWKDFQPNQTLGKIRKKNDIEIKWLTAQFNSKNKTARLEFQLADFDVQKPPPDADVRLKELRKMRVELQPKGTNGNPPEASFSREFIVEEGKLIVEIEVADATILEECDVLITSWTSLKTDAESIEKSPLNISQTDDEL